MISLGARARLFAGMLLLAAFAPAMSGCESGPTLSELAPKVPKLRADVPDSRHPESISDQYPNINEAPDRPSELRSDEEREAIENSLEQEGGAHVKEAIGTITGVKPTDPAPRGGKASGGSSSTPKPKQEDTGKPLVLSPSDGQS